MDTQQVVVLNVSHFCAVLVLRISTANAMGQTDTALTVLYDTLNILKISQMPPMPENVCDKLPGLSIRNSTSDLVFMFYS